MRGDQFCLFHSPEHAEDATEARRLGGLRRRREKTVSGACDFEGLDSVAAIRRILNIAVLDTLGLDNSLARSRTLIAAAQAATRLLEAGELEGRIAALETALESRRPTKAVEFEEVARASTGWANWKMLWDRRKRSSIGWMRPMRSAPCLCTRPPCWGKPRRRSRSSHFRRRSRRRCRSRCDASDRGFIKEVTREAVGDTVFLLRLVIGLNVHIEQTLRIECLRHAALVWQARAIDAAATNGAGRSGWLRGVTTLQGATLGTERARAAAEARYLDGRDSLFPELASDWCGLCERLADAEVTPDEDAAREAQRSVQRVILMARADGLEAAGQHLAADAMAERVGRRLNMAAAEAGDG